MGEMAKAHLGDIQENGEGSGISADVLRGQELANSPSQVSKIRVHLIQVVALENE